VKRLAGIAAALAALPVLVVVLLLSTIGGAANGQGCSATSNPVVTAAQPAPSKAGTSSIPANYLQIFQQVGKAYGVPWTLLAGIGEVESNDGRTNQPGVHSGQNGFGAAGPMQIGIGGAAGNVWGGAPVHPASEQVNGVATDFNHDGTASVYDPADAIAGVAKFLLAHGVLTDPSGAIFAYNHLTSYVQAVLHWASVYAGGTFTATAPQQCLAGVAAVGSQVPNQAVGTAIGFARQQIGKPYVFGATGPDAFDCSGLVMMAYRAAGIFIPRTSEQQWSWGPQVPAGQEQPGDLVFFAGSDGTLTSPGHVGLVIGQGEMIEAYATGFPIRISRYGPGGAPGDTVVVGFTRPWAHR
jgi:cell wall-associated NlpC family hydrolase